jgi:hypothetical protein
MTFLGRGARPHSKVNQQLGGVSVEVLDLVNPLG